MQQIDSVVAHYLNVYVESKMPPPAFAHLNSWRKSQMKKPAGTHENYVPLIRVPVARTAPSAVMYKSEAELATALDQEVVVVFGMYADEYVSVSARKHVTDWKDMQLNTARQTKTWSYQAYVPLTKEQRRRMLESEPVQLRLQTSEERFEYFSTKRALFTHNGVYYANGSWIAQWLGEGGKRRVKSFCTKKLGFELAKRMAMEHHATEAMR